MRLVAPSALFVIVLFAFWEPAAAPGALYLKIVDTKLPRGSRLSTLVLSGRVRGPRSGLDPVPWAHRIRAAPAQAGAPWRPARTVNLTITSQLTYSK